MCYTDKRKMNWIPKEDRVTNPIRPPGWVEYGDTGCHKKPLGFPNPREKLSLGKKRKI